MKAHYNQDVDILRIVWSESPIEQSDELQPGVILDYDGSGRVVGVEILNASRQVENLRNHDSIPVLQREGR
ncbi:DUF2283 domain-containing protein [Gloeobacter violaceus]|uniref:Gsr0563 protein n=1 Tax=Gloeobacter violaceus (strain ATCC 29082 / PCC 7421) TaxID=251221 RepID=Q7NN51_GLOVI|nr:DUF2283 domain-containing protein [Gloeobacter violaceus]BAC88504.1 gsr0563 [Gloeobacter violaceus PCC 7421]